VRILLADDQKEIRLLITAQLQRGGHYVVAVTNGREVLDTLRREPFDAILMDENMPVMSGLQTLRTILEHRNDYGPMVLVALTGYNSDSDRERLMRAGFDSVIGKPFRLEDLDALSKKTGGKGAQGGNKESIPAPVESPFAILLDRVGQDEQLARKMVATFLRDTSKRMVGIERALKRKDGVSLVSVAHALKGSVGIFGAQAAREHSQKLQDLGRAGDFLLLAQIYEQLKEEIAELEENLRGYARQKRSASSGASPKTKHRGPNPKREST
jgi:two-component system sensor histidine kinase/response regulator